MFNRYAADRHGITLVLGDPILRAKRLGGVFRADNVTGFVRLLEQSAGVRAHRRDEHTIVLWPVP